MTGELPPQSAPSDETEKERLDRNLNELLGELRVALPGVQVLFAFLLTVPFSQRFAKVTDFQEKVYFVTLLLTAVASALLIAPTSHHRLQFRQQAKFQIVATANKFAIAGLAALALAMVGAVLLITDFLFAESTTTIVVTALTRCCSHWPGTPTRWSAGCPAGADTGRRPDQRPGVPRCTGGFGTFIAPHAVGPAPRR